MSLITKPLLAARLEGTDLKDLAYPVAATAKFDGIRCLNIDGNAVSRTFKPIPNDWIRSMIERHTLGGMDMELVMEGYPSTGSFQETSGNVMRKDGKPDFMVILLDWVAPSWGLEYPYLDRMNNLEEWLEKAGKQPFPITVAMPRIINNAPDLIKYEEECLAAGYEGIMVRDPNGRYKCGRATVREGILTKIKRFEDQEAVIREVEELQHNNNEAQKDAFGRTKRSSHQENMAGGNTLGAFIVEGAGGDYNGVKFRVGTGFTQAQREQYWEQRGKLVGQIVTVQYFPTGVKDAPRFPTFKGFRDKRDI